MARILIAAEKTRRWTNVKKSREEERRRGQCTIPEFAHFCGWPKNPPFRARAKKTRIFLSKFCSPLPARRSIPVWTLGWRLGCRKSPQETRPGDGERRGESSGGNSMRKGRKTGDKGNFLKAFQEDFQHSFHRHPRVYHELSRVRQHPEESQGLPEHLQHPPDLGRHRRRRLVYRAAEPDGGHVGHGFEGTFHIQ